MQGIHRRVVQRLPVYPQSVRRFLYPRVSAQQSPLTESPAQPTENLLSQTTTRARTSSRSLRSVRTSFT